MAYPRCKQDEVAGKLTPGENCDPLIVLCADSLQRRAACEDLSDVPIPKVVLRARQMVHASRVPSAVWYGRSAWGVDLREVNPRRGRGQSGASRTGVYRTNFRMPHLFDQPVDGLLHGERENL